jgi:hypothetical protein
MIHRPFGSTVLSLMVVALMLATTAVWAGQESVAVALTVKEISAVPGQQIEIGVEQIGQDLPSGYFYTVAAAATVYPGSEEPDILSGYPVTKLTCWSVGQYVIRIRVHLVNKTSCGGASFETVLEDDVRITIVE